MSSAGHVIRVGLVVGGLLLAVGVGVSLVLRARVNSERVNCQNHLKDIGLLGMRHASLPGKPLADTPVDELPPGTVPSKVLRPDERLSWYAYTLNVLDAGTPRPDDAGKKRLPPRGMSELRVTIDTAAPWDAPANAAVARYRLTTAICPSRTAGLEVGTFQPNNYIAVGGLGAETPALPRQMAGAKAGAFRYDTPTPLEAFTDGLHHTAQFIETARDIGPWLRGGAATLRGLDVADVPYLGPGRAFGGCHPGGAFVSLADGGVTFLRDTIDPALFRAMFTIAGGSPEQTGGDS